MQIKKEFFEALEALKEYRIVFSYNGKWWICVRKLIFIKLLGKFPNFHISKHIKLVKWAPQLNLLNHPNTKVFLTHGGLKRQKFLYFNLFDFLVLKNLCVLKHQC